MYNESLFIKSTVEDNNGYIWFFHDKGISKFDGYNYFFHPYDELFDNERTQYRIHSSEKDGKGNIWISSFLGEILKIEPSGEILNLTKELQDLSGDVVIQDITSQDNSVLFLSTNGIIIQYDLITNQLKKLEEIPMAIESGELFTDVESDSNYIYVSSNQGSLFQIDRKHHETTEITGTFNQSYNRIKISVDPKGKVWIGTEGIGVYVFDPQQEMITSFTPSNYPEFNKRNNLIYSQYIDRSGALWLGTDGDGLYKVNTETYHIQNFVNDEINPVSIQNNTIIDIHEDSNKNMWIITKGGGVNVIPNNTKNINYHSGSENNSVSSILSIYKASDNSLWSGTDGKGLNRLYPNNLSVQYSAEKGFMGKFIQSIVEDENKNLWIGTYLNGLWIYNSKKDKFDNLQVLDKKGVEVKDIRFIFHDSKNRIWVNSDAGIYVYNKNRKLLAKFINHKNGIYGGISQAISEDKNGKIWIGINQGGLFSFDENKEDFTKSYFNKHLYYNETEASIYNYNIIDIAITDDGQLWLVTISGHLINYNPETNEYVHVSKKELKNVNFTAVLLEDDQNLWLSSLKGIIHYDLKNEVIYKYYRTDGLQGDIFNRRSAFKDPSGILYFGGNNGLNYFNPSEMKPVNIKGSLYFNEIEILNKPAASIIPDQVNYGLNNIDQLRFTYKQSSFGFQFSAVGNILNPNFRYEYRLKGFEEEWQEPRNNLFVSYTNIPHGDYSFEVRASSENEEWNIPTKKIDIHISPPWWFSIWAFMGYVLVALSIGYFLYAQIKLKSKLVKEEWQSKKDKEVYAAKMLFFTKMSHEIQTPLTLVLGTLDSIRRETNADTNPELNKRMSVILRNVRRLSRIATELTTSRDKELGKLKIQVKSSDIAEDLELICQSFEDQASFRNIKFNVELPKQSMSAWYDQNLIEHVIYNLLSNAFKFTPRKGEVGLKLISENDEWIKIEVKDSGDGIPEEELKKIFKLFYQTDLGKNIKGSGIGLALTKEIIELHHGKIDVVSIKGEGSVFTVILPKREDAYSPEEKINYKPITENAVIVEQGEQGKVNKTTHHKTLLIVEDNFEMQLFLQTVFSENFNVILAENGNEGKEKALLFHPDLIISDVMMPEVDGIQMIKLLKKNKATQHIPIILLSAGSKSNKLKGLQHGAIEYLYKPFNVQELILKVNNIISRSESVIQNYKKEQIVQPDLVNSKSQDDLFLEQLVNEINSQLDNENFKLEDLSTALNMSYSSVYRKCQTLTGKTLVKFVRHLRMKKASILFTTQGYGISEAAYKVGFSDPKYFSKCFKSEFGVAPSQFKLENISQ
ncbi:hybrid sensor histidine kinase/response regulator [Portibacter lacus]|uniref:histidine kinase n=1 Tax=Portibacter lacus TaxID=1099794 RepID=A0AA37SSF5_9BACT|nr:hybrid sensor histidine kinase/response regulator [Portibacter lacus]